MNKNKVGLTLTEMLIAMLAIAVVIGMAAQIIKPKRISIAPFVYAGTQNLVKGNSYIVNDESNTSYALPNPAPTTNGQTLADPYCVAVGDVFSTFDTPSCNVTCTTAGDSDSCSPTLGNYSYNLQASNQVSYSGLNGKWIAEPAPGTNNIKLVVMDINGKKSGNYPDCPSYSSRTGAGTLTWNIGNNINIGKECFLLAVYPNGNVIPAPLDAGGTNWGRCARKDDSGWTACQDMSFPFSYDVWETHTPSASDPTPNACTESITSGKDPNCRLSTLIATGLSYTDAVCMSKPECRRTPDNTANTDCPITYATKCNATQNVKPVYNGTTGVRTTSAGWDSTNCPLNDSDKECVVRLSKPKIIGVRF